MTKGLSMRHRHKYKILGRTRSSRRSLLRGLAISLIAYGRVTTTEAKAKTLRPFVERLITQGRTASLSSRRRLLAALGNETATKKILTSISPRYAQRAGGFTRIIRLDRRVGDAAQRAIIELV